LPDKCRFSFTQARNIEETIEMERQKHRAWLRRC
jgi:hypothetical protein